LNYKRLSALLLFCCSANATPTATGFFIGVDGAKHYISISEYFRNEGQSKAQQAEFFSGSTHAWSIGLSAGYGYELLCNLYVGLKAFGWYNTAEIVKKDPDPGKIIKFSPDGAEYVYNMSAHAMSTKPRISFGGAILIGYKVVPNALVYLSLGYEWTRVAFNQGFVGYRIVDTKGEKVYDVMGFSQGSAIAPIFSIPDTEEISVAVTLLDNGELSAKLTNFLPGIGLRYYFTKNIYVGGEASLSLGITRVLDAKHFAQGGKYSVKGKGENLHVKTLEELKSSVYTKPFGFRIGLSLGLTI
jgi:hypothetical protein